MTTKNAQQLIDENEEFEEDLRRQGMETIAKLKKQGEKIVKEKNK